MPKTSQREIAAVVTGHTRGLGAAIAAELLSRGARVLGVARHGNAEIAARHRETLVESQLDLADASAVTQWLAGPTFHTFLSDAPASALINNAGVLQPIGPLETQGAGVVARAVAVNVGAALMLSAAFAQTTSGASDRRILHISSGAASDPYAGWSIYCATKAALDQHARAVALDRSPRLRIASVAPGVIDTDMQTEIRNAPEKDFPERERFVELKREGRLRAPEDAARALVTLLLSDSFGDKTVIDLRYA
jgi:hypothetical protein